MLQVEFIKLLLAVHLDNEGNNEDEEGGADYPSRLTGALQEALGDVAGVGCGLLGGVHDRGLGHGG